MSTSLHPAPSGRRQVLAAALATFAGAVASPARAQVFPNKPVTLMVPFPPGSATDAVARALGPQAAKALGQQVIVENRPGAAGTMAASIVAQSNNPDGYTIAIAPASIFRVPHVQKVNYDPLKDLTYIMGFSAYTFSLVVSESLPVRSMTEFVAYAKANPGRIQVGASGAGSTGHVVTFLLNKLAGIDLTFVPFKGGSEVLQAFVGGHINAVIDGGWAQIEKQGKGRVIVTFQERRIARLPDVPTAREAGFDLVASSPIGLVGPRGMDPRVVRTLHDAFRGALADPTYRKFLETYDLVDAYLPADEYQKLGARLWVDEKRNFDAIGFKGQ